MYGELYPVYERQLYTATIYGKLYPVYGQSLYAAAIKSVL